MRVQVFEVRIMLADDDQTDPEITQEFIFEAIEAKVDSEAGLQDFRWPEGFTVDHKGGL